MHFNDKEEIIALTPNGKAKDFPTEDLRLMKNT